MRAGDAPLADGAQRKVLVGDASAEIPKLVNSVRELVANIGSLSAADSALGNSLRNLKSATDKLNGPHVAANTRGASTDLGALRTEVDTSLRKIQLLLNEVNRKWPFARDTELRLP